MHVNKAITQPIFFHMIHIFNVHKKENANWKFKSSPACHFFFNHVKLIIMLFLRFFQAAILIQCKETLQAIKCPQGIRNIKKSVRIPFDCLPIVHSNECISLANFLPSLASFQPHHTKRKTNSIDINKNNSTKENTTTKLSK